MINKTVKIILGLLAVLIALSVLAWMAYNYLVEMQPAVEERNPLPALLFNIVMLIVGIKWLRDGFNKESQSD